jgi:hypothetical protein
MSLGDATGETRDEHRTATDRATDDTASAAVVDAVTSVKGIDPATGEFCLHDHLDPDALDALIASGSADLTLTIPIDSETVTVDGDGRVTVGDVSGTR